MIVGQGEYSPCSGCPHNLSEGKIYDSYLRFREMYPDPYSKYTRYRRLWDEHTCIRCSIDRPRLSESAIHLIMRQVSLLALGSRDSSIIEELQAIEKVLSTFYTIEIQWDF